MGSLDKPNALRFITLFSGVAKGIAFYPEAHPAIRQPLTELHALLKSAFNQQEMVTWGLVDGIMFFDDHLFIAPSTAIADLTNRLLEKEIGRIVVTASLSSDALETFIRLFSAAAVRCDTLSGQLKYAGITGITLVRQGDESFDHDDDTWADAPTHDHIETYRRSLSAIQTICRDIERGRIPNSAPMIKIIDQMVEITIQEPSALLGLTMIKDYDNYTYNHCVNVGVLSMALGVTLGLDAMSVRDLGIAGQLHDIGKTMIPKAIINKPGKLSSTEFEEVKRHPELGSKIIREMDGLTPHIASMVLSHHLHHNRGGYPAWACQLPCSQLVEIIAIADTYDAITTLRIYQHPVNPRMALGEMQKMTPAILDSALFERFVGMMGNYPVGTLVRLDTNEVAIVYRPNPFDENAPTVRILIDSDGERLLVPNEQALVDTDGATYAHIVAVVDPLLKNINVGQLIASGNC
jgi:HD-GYP domain-containing protein (c-di-GMP phosphodiesterase class II)